MNDHSLPGSRPLDSISGLALLYLSLPIALFFLGWFNLPIGLALFLLLAIGVRHAIATTTPVSKPHRVPWQRHDLWGIVLIALVAVLWSLLGGAGHFFYANFDWTTRDAVLRDLALTDWPVGYAADGMFDQILRAPVAYYLPAAALSKVLGGDWASSLLWIWTAAGAGLFLSLLPQAPRFRWQVLGLIVVILFSGLDIVGWVTARGSLPELGGHIEWWARAYQYSSNSTQLFWVPNHALPAWIAIALLYRHWKNTDFLRFAPMLSATLPLWSPFAAIGMAPFLCLLIPSALRTRGALSVTNLAPAIGILAITGRYLTLDMETVPAQNMLAGGISLGFVTHYLWFVVLEFGLLSLILARRANATLLLIAVLSLASLPLFRLGQGNDLVMRGGVPALMLLCILTLDLFYQNDGHMVRRTFATVLLVIGAVTPAQEIIRAVALPAWKMDMAHNLVEASGGVAPPHYVAKLRQQGLIWMLRKPTHAFSPNEGPESISAEGSHP